MDINTFLASYPKINEPDFNKIIFNKKEFYDLKLSKKETFHKNTILNHQKLITRFLASYTLYDELLLFHSPGTGKTITAIQCIENILNSPQSTFKKAVIIVPNETLVEKFKSEIIFTGTQQKYFPPEEDDDEKLSAEELYEKRWLFGKKIIRKQYWITTHERFYGKLEKFKDLQDKLKSEYSNSIFILDEAHRVSNNPKWCELYTNLFKLIENRKILLMTGTPMKNSPNEILPLMNMILQNPIISTSEYELKQAFTGRVSYLKSKIDIPYEFQGKKYDGLAYPIVISVMSPRQLKTYQSINTNNKDVFFKNTLQASLFVSEDGSYGMNLYDKYIANKKVSKLFSNIPKNTSAKLNQIGVYSEKYKTAIQEILNHPRENVFVYNYFMRGSGSVLFGLCLQLFGFRQITNGNNITTKENRYAILSDLTGTDVKSVLKVFNSYENRHGEYIRVLIGGKQVEEGLTFYSLQQIHVLTPPWNFSNLDQALARGIRMRAHRYLRPNTPVKIYLHVSIPSENNLQCTDVDLYKNSQEKDIKIKEIEYYIKTSAFDCGLTYDRNIIKDKQFDNRRECEYKSCEYKCDGLDKYILNEDEIDKNTYQIYFTQEYKSILIDKLQYIFKKQSFITLDEIYTLLENQYTTYQLFHVLHSFIQANVVFQNKYGFQSYLQEENNIYFLTNRIHDKEYLDSYYNENPVIYHGLNFIDTIDYLLTSEDEMNKQIRVLSKKTVEEQIREIPEMHSYIQESFIENAILANKGGYDTSLTTWILNYYDKYIKKFKGNICSTFLDENTIRVLNSNLEWTTVIMEKHSERNIEELISSEHGIYGYINDKNKFVIINLSEIPKEVRLKESKKRGKVCSSHSVEELLKIMNLLKIPIPLERTQLKKEILCIYIQNWFEQHQLLI